MRHFIFVAVMIASSAFAQMPSQQPPPSPAPTPAQAVSNGGCPIEILEVNPQYQSYGSTGTFLKVKYRNASGKDIRAFKLGALFFNALDEPTRSYTHYISSEPVKADDKRPEKLAIWSQYDDTVDKADVYVIKVKFTDGTFWEDSGSFRCNFGVPELKIAKGGGLKAHEAAIKELERKTLKD